VEVEEVEEEEEESAFFRVRRRKKKRDIHTRQWTRISTFIFFL
jgi:hypothetical protein